MQENKENEEKVLDIRGTLGEFIEEEKPEVSQEDAIKSYREGNQNNIKKNKKKSNFEDEENEDDEHLKRVKRELLESLERVDTLAKKIFDEKDKENLKNIKVKSGIQKSKNREQVMEQMRQKLQEEKSKQEIDERSREG